MDAPKTEKIRRFLADKVMAQAVREALLDSFLRPKPHHDIHLLAASRMAVDFLTEAFADLQRSIPTEREAKREGNPGL